MLPLAQSHLKASTRQEDGFTLIELLVVMGIITTLAAIAVPMFLNNRQPANNLTVTGDIEKIMTKMQFAVLDNPDVQFTQASFRSTYPELQIDDDTELNITNEAGVGYCVQVWNAKLSKDYTSAEASLMNERSNSNACAAHGIEGTYFGQAAK